MRVDDPFVSPSSSGHARPSVPLLAAAVILSQLADLATYRPEIELNPLIHPETAVGLKVALVVLVLSTSYLVKSRLLMAAAIAAGLVGALSNVVAS